MYFFKNLDSLLITQSNKEINLEVIEGLVEEVADYEKALLVFIIGDELRVIKNGILSLIYDETYDCILESDYTKFKLKNKLRSFNELKNRQPLDIKSKDIPNNFLEGPSLARASENPTYVFKSPSAR